MATKKTHKIELREPATTRSSTSSVTKTFTTAATVWAAVLDRFADDKNRDGVIRNVQEKNFTINYRTDITKQWQIRFGSVDYQITGIVNVGGRNHELILQTIEAAL